MSIKVKNPGEEPETFKTLRETKPKGFFTAHKGECVAFAVIFTLTSLGIGAYLMYTGSLSAKDLALGTGGVLLLDVSFILFLYRKGNEKTKLKKWSEKPEIEAEVAKDSTEESPQKSGVYTAVSWNFARFRDYTKVCFLGNELNQGSSLKEAWEKLPSDYKKNAPISKEESNARFPLFLDAFLQFDNPDFICLQETLEVNDAQILNLLPQGYSIFTYSNSEGKDCTVAWRSEKFSLIDTASLDYSEINLQLKVPDTIVLLKDKGNGCTIAVASMHLRGFNLNYKNLGIQAHELNQAKQGDAQLVYDLKTLDEINADLTLVGGDFNVDRLHYPKRLNIIGGRYKYETDTTDTEPTILDANLKTAEGEPAEVKLDYVYAKAKDGFEVQVEKKRLNFKGMPSDHLPVAATLRLQPKAS